MVASQGIYRGATNLAVDVASCCCNDLMNNLISENFPKSTPWVNYSDNMSNGNYGYNERCGSFVVSTTSVPKFTKIDPCTVTHHEPADRYYTTRFGSISAYKLQEIRYDVRSLCGCDGICDEAELGNFVGLVVDTAMMGFAHTMDDEYLSAINGVVSQKLSSPSSQSSGLVDLTAEEDGIKTINAISTGLTFEVLLEARSILAQNFINYDDIMIVAPEAASVEVLKEGFKNGVLPSSFLYDRLRTYSYLGFNFYQTTDPLKYFQPITNTIRATDGTDVTDCIIAYAIPKHSLAMSVVRHQTPNPSGITNTSGISISLPRLYAMTHENLPYIYTGSDAPYANFRDMMAIHVDKTQNDLMIGVNIRMEAFFGVMRKMENSIVRIALPKKYIVA